MTVASHRVARRVRRKVVTDGRVELVPSWSVAATRRVGEPEIDPDGARPDRQRLCLARLGGDVGDPLSGRRRRVKRRGGEIGAIPLGTGGTLHPVVERDAGPSGDVLLGEQPGVVWSRGVDREDLQRGR